MKAYLKDTWPMDKKRTYSPVCDAKVYNKEAWEKLLNDFNESVKTGAYNKLPYTDWKVLHLMDGDYRVVWFEIDNIYLVPNVVHIQEFKYLKDSDNFRMVGTDKKYNISKDDYSFGTYLADMLFYDYFDLAVVNEKTDDYRLFGLTNLGAYGSEDSIGWRAINWALNPAVEGSIGQAIFMDVKKDIKNINSEFDKTTEILNNYYNNKWLYKVYEDVNKVKNTTFSDTTTINVSSIDPAKLNTKDTTASTASSSIDWGYRTTASTAIPIAGGSIAENTIKIGNDGSYATTISIDSGLTNRLDTMEESLLRIENRVKKGGHNIDTEAVTKRFCKRFEDLLTVLPYCNEATFYDNDNGFVTVAKYKNGELHPIGHKQSNWLNELIEKMN